MNKETIGDAYKRLHRKETDEIVDYTYDLEQENESLQSKLKTANKKLSTIKNQIQTQKSIIKKQPSPNKEVDNYFIARLDTILSIIGGE